MWLYLTPFPSVVCLSWITHVITSPGWNCHAAVRNHIPTYLISSISVFIIGNSDTAQLSLLDATCVATCLYQEKQLRCFSGVGLTCLFLSFFHYLQLYSICRKLCYIRIHIPLLRQVFTPRFVNQACIGSVWNVLYIVLINTAYEHMAEKIRHFKKRRNAEMAGCLP